MTSAGSGLGNWARLTLFSDTTTGTQLGIDLLNYFTDIRRLNWTINIDYEVSPSTFSRTTGLPTYFILHSTQSLFWLSEAFRAVRQSSQMMWPWTWWWWWWYRQRERKRRALPGNTESASLACGPPQSRPDTPPWSDRPGTRLSPSPSPWCSPPAESSAPPDCCCSPAEVSSSLGVPQWAARPAPPAAPQSSRICPLPGGPVCGTDCGEYLWETPRSGSFYLSRTHDI